MRVEIGSSTVALILSMQTTNPSLMLKRKKKRPLRFEPVISQPVKEEDKEVVKAEILMKSLDQIGRRKMKISIAG